ncbi:MAG: hypothetical protein QNI84_00605 [Henriciella sp.]|nr:hypothetical protein [Henriciella sp.]
MPRDVDERKKRKALRKLRKAAALAEQGLGPPLSDWEKQFLEEVEERIETYGSAFNDPEKGGSDEALSALQSIKLREIDKKARGKAKSGFKPKKSLGRKTRPSNTRQLNDDLEADTPAPVPPKRSSPQLVSGRDLLDGAADTPSDTSAETKTVAKSPPKLRVIKGGVDET